MEPQQERDNLLVRAEEILAYSFSNRDLLRQSVTHASIATTRLESNERLEFLGDAILGAVVSEALYARYPELAEGELTRMKSVLVSRETCARITARIGLHEIIRLGKGVRLQQKVPSSILAALYEAVLGAICLDGGYAAARDVILATISDEFETLQGDVALNYKSTLQQLSQKHFGSTPIYRLLDEQGPDHSKCFLIAAFIEDREFPAAWGNNKKQAEQRAAREALAEIEQSDLSDEEPDNGEQ